MKVCRGIEGQRPFNSNSGSWRCRRDVAIEDQSSKKHRRNYDVVVVEMVQALSGPKESEGLWPRTALQY
jgi:hypothetical protein